MNSDTVALIVLLAGLVTNVAVSTYSIRQARGMGRPLACLPLLGLAVVGLNILVGVSRDATSHNLWPFEILGACVLGVVYSFAFLGLKALVARKAKRPA